MIHRRSRFLLVCHDFVTLTNSRGGYHRRRFLKSGNSPLLLIEEQSGDPSSQFGFDQVLTYDVIVQEGIVTVYYYYLDIVQDKM